MNLQTYAEVWETWLYMWDLAEPIEERCCACHADRKMLML